MHTVGQKVCLWHEDVALGSVTVLKEVLVTITETKTGVLGHWSQKPVTGISLKGLGDDGKVYEKHWDSWPESQTSCFTEQWSVRDDGEGDKKFWIPKEAVHAHGELNRFNRDSKQKIIRKDLQGNPVVPKGDVIYCDEHDEYDHIGGFCFLCHIENIKNKKAA